MFNRFHSDWWFALLALAIATPSFGAQSKPVGQGEPARTDPVLMAPTSTLAASPSRTTESTALNEAGALDRARQDTQAPAFRRLGSALTETVLGDAAATKEPETAAGLAYNTAQTLDCTASSAVELSLIPKPGLNRNTRGPPARTLFARSQDLDVTEAVSVSQILVLDQAIGPGTRLKIMAYSALGTWYQTTDPDGPNYVELSSPETGVWTAILPESIAAVQPSLEFELATGYFEAGQTLEIRYQRLQGPKTLEQPLTLPIAIQFPNESEWLLLPGERRQFVPGPAAALQIIVDQQIEVNQRFDLIVQPIDERGNPTPTTVQSFDLLINNRLLTEVNLISNQYVAADLTIETLGRHQFSARSPAGGLQSKAETVWVLPHEPEQVIWTDFSERSLGQLIAALPIEVRVSQNVAFASPGKGSNPSSNLTTPSTSNQNPQAALASNPQAMAPLSAQKWQTAVESFSDENAAVRNPLPATRSGIARPNSIEQSTSPALSMGQKSQTTQVVPSVTLNPQGAGLFDPNVITGSRLEAMQTSESRTFSGRAEDLQTSSALVEQVPRTSQPAPALLGEKPVRSDTRQTGTHAPQPGRRPPANNQIGDARDTANGHHKTPAVAIQPGRVMPKPLANGLYANLQTIETGGQSATLVVGDTALYIAQPELTTDRRGRRFNLVEQSSGPSGHQWLSDYFADLGQTFGIMSQRTSFQPRTHRSGPQTAIVVRSGQTWLDALAKGQTFVSTGAKARLSFSVNGALFGRTSHQAQRTLSVAVTSIERPLWIRLYRNGDLLKQLPFKATDASPKPSESLDRQHTGRLFLYLESDSKPFALGVTPPRNGREWLGQIKLQNMALTSNTGDPLEGLTGHRISQSPDKKQLDFLTWTHGAGALIQLDLAHQASKPTVITPNTRATTNLAEQTRQAARDGLASPGVILEIAEGYEDLTYFDPNRPPAATPSFTERFDLESLQGQGIQRTLSIDGYLDQISLWYEDQEPEKPNRAAPPTHQATYLDRRGGRPGDYYTCQVLLRNGTVLFSSPIFVGGFDPQ